MAARTSSSSRGPFSPQAAIGAMFALAGVFVLLESADQLPGSNRQMLGLSSMRVKKLGGRSLAGLTLEDYDGVVRRALTSTDKDAEGIAAHEKNLDLDYEEIARRVLKEEPRNSRHLSPDSPNYEIIRAAQNVHKRNSEKQPFLFVLEASVGMIPMVKSWICNTATMEGVHENTLLILDEPGKKLLDAFDPAKGMHVVQDSIPKSLEGSWDYGRLGYWRMTQSRFHTILDIVELGNVPIMIIEADAVWLGSPFDDPEITTNDADVVGFVDGADRGSKIMGFGFLRLNPTDTVINLLHIAAKSVDETLTAASNQKGGRDEDGKEDPTFYVGMITGEQTFFSRLVMSFHKENPNRNFVHVLHHCRYPAGSWFIKPKDYNDKCNRDEQDSIVVLQNNWIIGNEAKMNRAKEWGQWFVTEDGDRCIEKDLTIARQSVNAGVKPTDLKIA